MNYSQKYLKYKAKYLNLQKSKINYQSGGALNADQQAKIDAAKETIPNGDFYLFGYGSNGPTQLAERLSNFDASSPVSNRVTEDDLITNTFAAKAEGWSRGFFGYSEGRQGSVATIYQKPGHTVSGTALKMTSTGNQFLVGGKNITFDNLLISEAVQFGKYLLQPLGNIKIWNKNTKQYESKDPVYAFVGNLNYQPPARLRSLQGSQPSTEYVGAIANHLYSARLIAGFPADMPIVIMIKIWKNNEWATGNPDKRRYLPTPSGLKETALDSDCIPLGADDCDPPEKDDCPPLDDNECDNMDTLTITTITTPTIKDQLFFYGVPPGFPSNSPIGYYCKLQNKYYYGPIGDQRLCTF